MQAKRPKVERSYCKFLRFFQAIELADIKDIEVGLDQSDDVGTVAHGEVEVDDAEAVGEVVHQRKEAGREAVDAGEGEGVEFSV